ncbi:Ca2+-binding protein, EF-hand superfamily [Rhizobium mongolense subsp. loessense]|uniref:Ca2+-binding protein, EF-hand superfamily n=1 Tax=Rhizobium mongolense subsp. loessense TaxID=158890 RepID=A0A1G4U5W5_9HYPH|nr:EF-hand domain-containing protein [Rhizobium mongolense]SCW89043.1 Ca2+-binding protein, EF-hand superfamily [Rhizobium mongolense subsp. loessense]
MTTISSATSAASYPYTKLAIDSSEQSLSSSTVSTGKARKAESAQDADDAVTESAQKLFSQLMAVLMNSQEQQARTAGQDQDCQSAADAVASMDSDGDGIITASEFVAAKPSDVTENQASTLFASLDTENTGAPSADALSEAMSTGKGARPTGQAFGGEEGLSSLFSALDTDGDGVITQEEFATGRPDSVTEDEANALFESIESESSGSLTGDQFIESLRAEYSAAMPAYFNKEAGDDTAAGSVTRMTI